MTQPNVQIKVDVSSTENKLEINYIVSNRSGVDIYLVNRVFRLTPKKEMHKDIAYISLGENGVLNVFKDVPPVPEGMVPVEMVAPFLTPVRVGEDFHETIALDLPVQQYMEYVPNDRPVPEEMKIINATSLHFTLGYYVGHPKAEERVEKYFNQDVVLFKNPPGILAQHYQLQFQSAEIYIPVIER